jgi:hypothetical protein
MHYQKHINRVIIVLSLLVSFLSCKKLDKDNPIEFKIKAHIPYNDEPISGVKYTIREYRSKKELMLSDIEYTDFILEGVTDANGNANISFAPKKNMKYHYDITFDYSNLQFANYSGSYSLIKVPNYVPLSRNDQQDFEIRVLPHCSIHYKVENVNCFDANDKMRFKTFNCDEFPNQSFQYITVWGNYFNGCGSFFDDTINNMLSGRKLYQIEVTRNNVVTIYIDTFFLQPGITNEVFIEY